MKEIGGYLEFPQFNGEMLYDDAIKLNCGRNAFDYIVKAKKIKKIWIPIFICDSIISILEKNNVKVCFYNIGLDFKPVNFSRLDDEWMYVVNFYGQYSNEYIKLLGKNVIVDNAQAYFQKPIADIDTLYTCRKFFGVSDGSILYTNAKIDIFIQDESYTRANYLLGRYERGASEFYQEYVHNNNSFENEPIKIMSKLTENLLHGIDYEFVKKRRTSNFQFLFEEFCSVNKLHLIVPEGAFMYPLYVKNGAEIRKELHNRDIYIPILWPNILEMCDESDFEYDLAKNTLPLPVDQRYSMEEMKYMATTIWELMEV